MKPIFTILILLLTVPIAGCESESRASEPVKKTESGRTIKVSEALKKPAPKLETTFSLTENRHLAHRFDQHGLVIDMGEAGALKYIQGRWNSTWYRGKSDDGFRYAHPRGVSGTLRFPIWVPGAAEKTKDWKLTIRLKPEGDQRCDLFLARADGDEEKFASLNQIKDGWGAYTVDLPDGLATGQEYSLRLHFSRSRSIEGGRSAAAIDWIRVGPTAGEESPVRLDEMTTGAGLKLPEGSALVWYTHPAKGAKFHASVDGTASLSWATETTKIGSARIDLPSSPIRLILRSEAGATLENPRLGVVSKEPETVSEKRPKYVLVWLIDTLRADHLKVYNSKTDVDSPNLTAWAKEAAVFESTTCQGNSSLPTSAAIFTSAYAPNHGLTSDKARLPRDRTLLGEAFKGAGWKTALYSSNGYVSNTWGFARGFEVEVNPIREERPSDTEYLWPEAKAWLEKTIKESPDRPAFLYVNTVDPHVPYDPPSKILAKYHSGGRVGRVSPRATGELLHEMAKGGAKLTAAESAYMHALYKGEITYNDLWFGKMLADLEAMGIRDQTMIVVSSDHGEEFGEYGRWGHGVSVNQELVDIPLIIGFEPWTKKGVRVPYDVEIVDIMPTLLDAAGIKRPPKLQGASLVELIRSTQWQHPRPAFAYHNDFLRSARVGNLKYQLFNGDQDPLYVLDGPNGGWDRKDVSDERPFARRMMRDLIAFQLALDKEFDKSKHGAPNNHSSALADKLDKAAW